MLISAIKVKKMLSKGYTGFITHVVSKVEVGPSINKMPIVREFLNVFLKKLLRLALEREIEFNIELALNTILMSKAPYKITAFEL